MANTFANYPLGVGPVPVAVRRRETVEQRLDRLERNFANFHAAFENLQLVLERADVLSANAAAQMALHRATNLWNVLLAEGVTRTSY